MMTTASVLPDEGKCSVMRVFNPPTNFYFQAALNSEVNKTKPAMASHLIGDDAAMTMRMIALKTKETCYPLRGGIQSATHIGLRG